MSAIDMRGVPKKRRLRIEMKRPLLSSLLAGSFVFGTFAASADDNELFDDRYYVSPMGSLTGNRRDLVAVGERVTIGWDIADLGIFP